MIDALLDLTLGGHCVGCQRPGRILCLACAEALPRAAIAVTPDPAPAGLAPVRAMGDYSGTLKAMVIAHKERSAFGLTQSLAALLARSVAGHPIAAGNTTVLVPVPSRWLSVVRRGHDPLWSVVRRAARILDDAGASAEPVRLLRLARAPADQAGLDWAARQDNLAGAMAVRAGVLAALARREGAFRVVLCDDVVTSGATVAEAQAALQRVGVSVSAIACVAATRRVLPKRGFAG